MQVSRTDTLIQKMISVLLLLCVCCCVFVVILVIMAELNILTKVFLLLGFGTSMCTFTIIGGLWCCAATTSTMIKAVDRDAYEIDVV